MSRPSFVTMGLLTAALTAGVPASALAQAAVSPASAEAAPAPSEVTPDAWPKSGDVGGTKYTLYQPQLDSWNDYVYLAHAAVSVLPQGSQDPIFGVVELRANTIVDKQAKTVHFENLTVTRTTFPSVPQMAATYQQAIQGLLAQGAATMSLGRLEAAVAIEGAERKSRRVPVLNEPPRIVFSSSATVLVLIHGEPVWHAVTGTSLSRVMNTRALVLSEPSGNVFVHVLDGFMTAPSLNGPWSVAVAAPAGAAQTAQALAQKNVVDLMEGPVSETTGKRPSLAAGTPGVVVATKPTEVIITQGPMNWVPLDRTQLLYVQNTNGNVFQDLVDQQFYVLVTGRWFRSSSITGPWAHVPGDKLPPDFALIPVTSPKENVLASVPGTFEAQEAVISAEIPQMATIYRVKVSFQPVISGVPVLTPISDTPLQYVFNSPDAIIRVSASQWYAVQTGVWFIAPTLNGPWVVATSVPAVIYSIPPSAPLFYTTFVQIYASTPETVVVGYTPGYTGVVVEPGGLVVYGTGYSYVAYVGPDVWYPPPVTYGYAANLTYTPWTGFAVGFAVGWGVAHACYAPAPYWGAMPYAYHGAAYGPHGAAAWGPNGWAATSGNIYHQYGATSAVTRDSAGYNAWTGNAWSSKVGTSYNSVTGRASAGQSSSVSNAYTGGYAHNTRGATYNPSTGVGAAGSKTTVGNAYTGQQATVGHGTVSGPGGTTHVAEAGNNYYADHNGNVYNYNSQSGQAQKQNSNGSWSSVDKPSGTSSYQPSSEARQAGDAKSASSSWGSSSWGGGGSHSGSSWGGSSGGWGGGESHSGGGWGGGGSGGGGGRSWGGGGFGGGGGGGFGGFHGGGGGFRR